MTTISVVINKDGYIVTSSENDKNQWLATGKLKDKLNEALIDAVTDGIKQPKGWKEME